MFEPNGSPREIFTARQRLAIQRTPRGDARATLTVERVGYLVPTGDLDGIVHSVFAHACNIACDNGLLTVVAGNLTDGPTVWRLAGNAAPDFRRLFRPGERLRHRRAVAVTQDVALDLSQAARWRPAPPPAISLACLAHARFATNLPVAVAVLEQRRRVRSSVIDCEAKAPLDSLEVACRRLDVERATAEIHRLVGWGEGLTPAGDDALAGVLAALGVLAPPDADRLAFLRSLSAAIDARTARTTVISAHYLHLAAQQHFNADVTRLAHALVGDDGGELAAALAAALDVGATSGAAMATGMIAGLRAWCPMNS